MSKKKQELNKFYIGKLKEHKEQATNSLNQLIRQSVMVEGVIVFLNQAIEEAEKEDK